MSLVHERFTNYKAAVRPRTLFKRSSGHVVQYDDLEVAPHDIMHFHFPPFCHAMPIFRSLLGNILRFPPSVQSFSSRL